MSYDRVIPRDLFNEANLLKCVGQVSLHLHDKPIDGVYLMHWSPDEPFQIEQDPSNGAIYISNLPLVIRGVSYTLTRPLNTRRPWPIYAQPQNEDTEEVSVFDEEGRFTPEMYALLTGIPQS